MNYFIILVFLLVIYILNKRSKNDFFYQDEDIIRKKLDIILSLWQDFGFTVYDEIKLRLAFEYFIKNPNEYNGTSIINDMWLIRGLEPESVIHDYEDIIATSSKHLLKSNKTYCQRLRKRNAQFFWVWGFIYCGLTIVTLFKSIKFIKI